MPSVLLLCEYATLNGGERSMLSTLDTIIAAGWQVRVAAPAAGALAHALRRAGVEPLPFEPRNADGVRLPLDESRHKLADLLRQERPTLLHANSLAMGRLSGPVAKELSLPSLSHLRDIITLSRQAIADLNCHSRLLAVSAATRNFHAAQGLAADRTFVLHNGVDLEQFRPRPPSGYLHRELGLPPNLPLIGTIGQISLRKGHDLLATALAMSSSSGDAPAAELLEERPFAWLIIGERYSGKEESRRFETQLHQAAAGKLVGKIYFLGIRDDVDRILNELTLLVHPARQEPLGRVLIEAAAAGAAIVATDVGGTREVFPAKCEAACLVPRDDVRSLAAAIVELLADPVRRLRLCANARKRAEMVFDRKHAAAELRKHYEAVAMLPTGL